MQEKTEQKKQWTSRSIGSRFQHNIFYALIRIAGRRGAYTLLVFVVFYYVLFNQGVRQRSSYYISRRFPYHLGLQRLIDTYLLSLEVGKVLVDRAVLGILGPDKLKVDLTGRQELEALLQEGKGLILVTAHVGSWQVAMSVLTVLGRQVHVLIHREEGDVDRHYFEHDGGPPPYRLIDPAGFLGGTLEMLEVLKHGEVLCIMGDRPMGGEGSTVPVQFLDGEIQVPFSPYKLASATGAPIAAIYPYKSDSGSYALKLAGVIRVPADLGRQAAAYRPYAQEFSATLERFVADYPYQFFNFYDMWGDPDHTA